MPDTWQCPETNRVFLTGAVPTARHVLCGAIPFRPRSAPPVSLAYVPTYRSMLGNDRFGDCVSAEEGFAKTCMNPERFNSQAAMDELENIVIAWARKKGWLNGASLDGVLDDMLDDGYHIGSQIYNDGPKSTVDFSNEAILQAAIAQGPVKIAIAASALPAGAGSRDGWYQLGSRSRNTDHCTSLCGYGTAGFLFDAMKRALPSGLSKDLPGYLQYTWSTIGFVDHAWIMGTVDEGWVRNPTTVGIPPIAPPSPPVPPPPSPVPSIIEVAFDHAIPAGEYILIPKIVP